MAQVDTSVDSNSAYSPLVDASAEKLYDKCLTLAGNLWWSWHPEVTSLFRDMDPIRWRQLDHNPIALLREFTPERLAVRANEMVLTSRVNYAYRRLQEYLESKATWAATHAGSLGAFPVAYFSAEFGIHESLPIYSGGLGVLSGDHVKSASGLGVPLVAVGLYYSHGYFKQQLDGDALQREEYQETRVENLPMEPALAEDGKPIMVAIDTRNGRLLAKVWAMNVGRIRLYLLDCNVEGNKPEDRELTSRLYGGDERTRIRQELVLGVGGVKALRALGITPGVYHLNEGHSGFAPLEVIRERMQDDGLNFEDASAEVALKTIFTTHTPVPAGHDRFGANLIEEHLGPLRDSLGISHERLMGIGRVRTEDGGEPFCMTVIGLKFSNHANAVSQLHGQVSRKMWNSLFPNRATRHVPIGHITNGVHTQSWLAWQMQLLFDRHFPTDWMQRIGEPDVWQKIHEIDPGELWEVHNAMKSLMFSFVRRRVSRQCRRRGESDAAIEAARNIFSPNVLTIGFGRRFATYKRANLIFSDVERISALLQNTDRPVQLIYTGKAHPKDEPGKRFIQQIASLRNDSRFADKVAFIEDYDINVCRHLIQGVDVWLNNPRRPLEASGTSGQKVILNGGLNLSILDGWWAEAFDGSNGFAIGKGHAHMDDAITDRRDAADLYEALEQRVIPIYYNRDRDGLPRQWIRMMMNSISTLAWRFSSHRMVMDYTKYAYVPAAGGLSCDMNVK